MFVPRLLDTTTVNFSKNFLGRAWIELYVIYISRNTQIERIKFPTHICYVIVVYLEYN